MKLNVFELDKWNIQIDSTELNIKKHLHINTHKEFTQEDLESFWIKTEIKETKKTKK